MKVVSFVLLVMGTSLTAAVWAFATFETKETSQERKSDIIKRLDSIESKVDHLLLKGK